MLKNLRELIIRKYARLKSEHAPNCTGGNGKRKSKSQTIDNFLKRDCLPGDSKSSSTSSTIDLFWNESVLRVDPSRIFAELLLIHTHLNVETIHRNLKTDKKLANKAKTSKLKWRFADGHPLLALTQAFSNVSSWNGIQKFLIVYAVVVEGSEMYRALLIERAQRAWERTTAARRASCQSHVQITFIFNQNQTSGSAKKLLSFAFPTTCFIHTMSLLRLSAFRFIPSPLVLPMVFVGKKTMLVASSSPGWRHYCSSTTSGKLAVHEYCIHDQNYHQIQNLCSHLIRREVYQKYSSYISGSILDQPRRSSSRHWQISRWWNYSSGRLLLLPVPGDVPR